MRTTNLDRLAEEGTRFSGYYSLTLNLVRKWLNRRCQKRSMSWAKFSAYLSHYPLPKPSIRHNFYTGYPCYVK